MTSSLWILIALKGFPSLERLVEYVESELAAMRKSEVRRP